MDKIAHTVGPWHVFEPIDKGSAASVGAWLPGGQSRHLIASVWPIYEDDEGARRNDPQATANAVLIASAPDLLKQRDALLAACKAAEYGANHVDCVSAMQHALPLIRAAIALTEQPK